jgi:hypothetical protein
MSHPLDGCWVKVNRANMHLSLLDERIQRFVDSNPYKVETEPGPNRGEEIVYANTLREPPTQEWSAIVGDIVHNLRSALDHLVWQLTLANGHTPPAVVPRLRHAPGGKWRDVGFPIFFTPRPTDHLGNLISWDTAKDLRSLWGVRPSLRADIQGLQPFNHGKDAPKQPLAILDELWNIDKHRHLNFTSSLLGLHDTESAEPIANFRILQRHTGGPFKGRTPLITRVHVGSDFTPIDDMHMKPRLSFDISFEEGPPAYGGRVIESLESLRDTVAAILGKFDSEFT